MNILTKLLLQRLAILVGFTVIPIAVFWYAWGFSAALALAGFQLMETAVALHILRRGGA